MIVTSRHLSRRNFQLFDSQSTVNSQQSTSCLSATGIDMTGKAEEYQEALKQKQAPGYGALGVMEQHLANHAFFTGDRYTIADIGLFAYTHFAGESGFDLTRFLAIQS